MTTLTKPAAIVWTPIRVRLGDLIPWERNPRSSTRIQAERILASFAEFGQVQTVAVGPGLDVYDGHQRLSALQTLYGADYEVDARQSSRPLTTPERERLVLLLHAGAVGAWDWDDLSAWDEGTLTSGGIDGAFLESLNRDRVAVSELLAGMNAGAGPGNSAADAEPQVDRAAELREAWATERGQVWQLGPHRLMCGDSTNPDDVARLMGADKPGAVLTDPPYGMRLDADYSEMKAPARMQLGKGITGGVKWNQIAGDGIDYDPAPLFDLWSAPEMFLFGADYYAERLRDKNGGSWLVWDKRLEESADKMFGSAFELCWSRRRHKRDLIRVKWAGVFGTEREDTKARVHPAHKPTLLFRWIIERHIGAGAIVADPYAGGGSCLMACEQTGRVSRAMELDPGYVAVILERYSAATGQTPARVEP